MFATKGGANIEIFREIVNAGKIAPTTVALMLTFVSLYFLSLSFSSGIYLHRLSMPCKNIQKGFIVM